MSERKYKTWVDLLGTDLTNCIVEGCFIVRDMGGGKRVVVYRADNSVYAKQIMQIWGIQVSQLDK